MRTTGFLMLSRRGTRLRSDRRGRDYDSHTDSACDSGDHRCRGVATYRTPTPAAWKSGADCGVCDSGGVARAAAWLATRSRTRAKAAVMLRLVLAPVLACGCTLHAMESARFDPDGNIMS